MHERSKVFWLKRTGECQQNFRKLHIHWSQPARCYGHKLGVLSGLWPLYRDQYMRSLAINFHELSGKWGNPGFFCNKKHLQNNYVNLRSIMDKFWCEVSSLFAMISFKETLDQTVDLLDCYDLVNDSSNETIGELLIFATNNVQILPTEDSTSKLLELTLFFISRLSWIRHRLVYWDIEVSVNFPLICFRFQKAEDATKFESAHLNEFEMWSGFWSYTFCSVQYIGQTKQQLETKTTEHCRKGSPVEQFHGCGVAGSDVTDTRGSVIGLQ